ncbi:MAG: polysaccharide pyruvyl transferase family protein [Micrococcus sp.]|nr:polysaccharide pyruvyl transferase family protein [Micrococcus sp.]
MPVDDADPAADPVDLRVASHSAGTGGLPTLVSFYAGDQYYYQSAARLRADCERLGMPHHIEELPAEGLDWGAITREKIAFYRRMHERFGAILWVDADTRLVSLPEHLRGCAFDLAGFAGRYRYIRDYDPYQVARFWIPSFLYFGPGRQAREFLDLMVAIEHETEEQVTDDFVLQEAWARHEGQLAVGLLPPALVARPTDALEDQHVFVHGDSGNVSTFKAGLVQHGKIGNHPAARSQVLGLEAVQAMKEKDRSAAVMLARRSLAAIPTDSEAAVRLSRYLKIAGQPDAVLVLRDQLDLAPGLDDTRHELAVRLMERGDFDGARHHLDHLAAHGTPQAAGRAASLRDDVERDARARALGLTLAERPRLWWRKTPYPGNFDDVLNPWLVEWLTGRPPVFGGRNDSLLASGSFIPFATGKSTVWGAGIPRRGSTLSPEARYLAVRGPVTREEVIASGGSCPEVYGDPALLLPRFVPAARGPKRNEVGFIRHVSQDNLELSLEGVADIRPSGVGEGFLRRVVGEITSCERVISTSLHGLVVAHAYGIPARWAVMVDASEAISGDGTDVEDYFRAVGLPVQAPLELSRDTPITPALAEGLPASVQLDFDGDALADALVEGLDY